jgi:O-antigen/teichoic acid export membrane protein
MSEYVTFISRIGLVGIAKFITSLRGLILLPILAKTLGVVGYGIWAQILVTIGLLISFVTLNLSAGMVRFLPAEKEKRKIARAIFTVIFTVLFVAVVFALVLFLLSDPFAKILLKDASASFFIKIAAFLLVLEALGQTSLESFRIFGQIKRYSTLIVLQTFLEIGLVSLLTLSGFGLLGVLIAFLIARSIILLFSLLFIVSYVGFAVPCFGILRSYLVFALPLIPIGLLEVIIASSDRYIIGFFKGSASVGIYSATYNIGLIAGIFIFPIAYILSPTVFKLFDEKKIEKVKMYLSYSLKYFLLISIPSVFGLTILTKSILSTLATPEFVTAISMFVVLFVSLSSIFYGIQAIFGRALMLFKHTKSFLIAFIVAAIINLGLNIVLIPCWGIIGAAITTLIAYALSAIIIYCKSRQYIKFNFDLNFVIKSMVASSVMAGAIYIFNPIGIIKILLAIGFGATIYFYILFLLKGFGKGEIEIIYRVLKFKKSQTKKYEQTF